MSTSQSSSCSRQYTVYGHDGCEQFASVLGFSGQRMEPATGCYLLGNGYRAFNPVLMRFHSPDSLSPMGAGGLNCYAYCAGDPVNNTDPSGHMPRSKIKLSSIRTKVGSTKSGFSLNPDVTGDTFTSHVVSRSVVRAVNLLGRGYGSQIEPIMNAPIWSDKQKLLVEGSVITLADRIGKKTAQIASHSGAQNSVFQEIVGEEQRRNLEALKVLAALHSKMAVAENVSQPKSWLHDPRRLVSKVRDPGKVG